MTDPHRNLDDRLRGNYGRFSTMALKLALILARNPSVSKLRIQPRRRVVLLPGVQVAIRRRSGLGGDLPVGVIAVGVGDAARRVAQGAGAAERVGVVVTGGSARLSLRDQLPVAQHVAGQQRAASVQFGDDIAIG